MIELQHFTVAGRLAEISLTAPLSGVVHILGPNGAGKSTLLEIIAGLLEGQGQVRLKERPISDYTLVELAAWRGFLPQNPQHSAQVNTAQGLSFFTQQQHLPAQLEQHLEVTGLLHKPLGQLSGGERQRVQLARVILQIWPALQNGNALLLLDEPFQGLDYRHQHLLCQLLAIFASVGNLVIISQHDINLASQYAEHCWLLEAGSLVFAGATMEALTVERLQSLYQCRVDLAEIEDGEVFFRIRL